MAASIVSLQDPRTGKTPKCCDGGLDAQHPNCLPIEIPSNDHFYKLHKRRCMNFVRVIRVIRFRGTCIRGGCLSLKSWEPF